MNPMSVRLTVGRSPSASTRATSSPGAENPVQETTISSVTSSAATPPRRSASAAARAARGPEHRSYASMRIRVESPRTSSRGMTLCRLSIEVPALIRCQRARSAP